MWIIKICRYSKENCKKKLVSKGLGVVKSLYFGKSKIEINSLKPQASIATINKIISNKVIDYDLDVASTGSMYLRFEVPEKDTYFEIRISDHSKIDGIDDDTINEYRNEIEINIFSAANKKRAISYLTSYFLEIKKLPINEKNIFINKVVKKVIKSKHNEVIIAFLKKLKIDSKKTNKQIQQSILDYLVKKGSPAILRKREYTYTKGRWVFKEEKEIKGNITAIATTGGQITINKETGKNYNFVNEKDSLLKLIAVSQYSFWLNYIEKFNQLK